MSCVYFMAAGDPAEFVRIGTSSNPQERMRQLQPGCPLKLRLLGVYIPDGETAEEAESRFQAMFQPLRTRGDWLRADTGLLCWIEAGASG